MTDQKQQNKSQKDEINSFLKSDKQSNSLPETKEAYLEQLNKKKNDKSFSLKKMLQRLPEEEEYYLCEHCGQPTPIKKKVLVSDRFQRLR